VTINPFYKFAWPGFIKLVADDKLTVACLVAVCDNETLTCAVSTRYVSEWTRLSRAQVFKCLYRLTVLHVIKKIAVIEGVGFGRSRFQLNPVFNTQPPDRSQIDSVQLVAWDQSLIETPASKPVSIGDTSISIGDSGVSSTDQHPSSLSSAPDTTNQESALPESGNTFKTPEQKTDKNQFTGSGQGNEKAIVKDNHPIKGPDTHPDTPKENCAKEKVLVGDHKLLTKIDNNYRRSNASMTTFVSYCHKIREAYGFAAVKEFCAEDYAAAVDLYNTAPGSKCPAFDAVRATYKSWAWLSTTHLTDYPEGPRACLAYSKLDRDEVLLTAPLPVPVIKDWDDDMKSA
jgi:hypothetical protein